MVTARATQALTGFNLTFKIQIAILVKHLFTLFLKAKEVNCLLNCPK